MHARELKAHQSLPLIPCLRHTRRVKSVLRRHIRERFLVGPLSAPTLFVASGHLSASRGLEILQGVETAATTRDPETPSSAGPTKGALLLTATAAKVTPKAMSASKAPPSSSEEEITRVGPASGTDHGKCGNRETPA